jgi:hypothetical protein
LSSRDSFNAVVDISGRNIAFSCSNLSNAAEEDLFEVIGLPETEELVRLDGKPLDKGLPKHMVKAAEWDEWVDEDEEDLRVLDLGEGFLQEHQPKTLSQPGQLQAPETIFGNSFDHRVDLWRAGCMVSGLMRSAGRLNVNVFNADLFVHIQNIAILVPWR